MRHVYYSTSHICAPLYPLLQSEVQGASTCSSPPRNGKPFGATVSVLQPLRSAETTAGFSGAHQKALQTSGYSKPSSISPMDGAETSFCICLQLNDVSHDSGSAELKHWYNEADKSHQRAREVVIIQVFHLLLEHKIATQLGEILVLDLKSRIEPSRPITENRRVLRTQLSGGRLQIFFKNHATPPTRALLQQRTLPSGVSTCC